MHEDIDVTGIPEPCPITGCGYILFIIGAFGILTMIGYWLFTIALWILILYILLLCTTIGFLIILGDLKQRNHEIRNH